MPNRFWHLSSVVPSFNASEPLFESQRLQLHTIPVAQSVLSGGKGSDSNQNDDQLIFEPKKDEFKDLAKVNARAVFSGIYFWTA